MRVTNKMMSDNLLRNLNTNLREMSHTQNKLSTGMRIQQPSDDPGGTARVLSLRSQETEMARYKQNIDDADSWLTTTDSSLGEVDDVLQRVRELTVYAASDSIDEQSREALAEEVAELNEHLVEIANTDHGKKHIFGGHNTTRQPFEMMNVEEHQGADGETHRTFDVAYQGNQGNLNIDISADVTVPKNLNGVEAFGNTLSDVYDIDLDEGETIGDIDLALTEGENQMSVVELEGDEIDNPNGDVTANYGLENEDGEIVAVSQDGRGYYVLENATEAGDLGDADIVETGADDNVAFRFAAPQTEGEVTLNVSEDGALNNVSATQADTDISSNMFNAVNGIYESMMDHDTDALSKTHLKDLDHWMENNLDNRAAVGARQNRLELSKNRMDDLEHLTAADRSEIEEADMAETIMDLKSQENVHRMALSAGARIIQPTLLDFLQ